MQVIMDRAGKREVYHVGPLCGRRSVCDNARAGRLLRDTACQRTVCEVPFVPMHAIGRIMQLAGLIVPPLSILAQLNGAISVGQMLLFLVAAVCAFWIGRIVEGYGAR